MGALFLEVLELCREAGLVSVGHLSVDGAKYQANASKHKAMRYGRIQETEPRLREEVAAVLRRAAEADAAEDAEYGPDQRGDELPEELRRRASRRASRREKIAEAQARLEARARKRARERAAAQGRCRRASSDAVILFGCHDLLRRPVRDGYGV